MRLSAALLLALTVAAPGACAQTVRLPDGVPVRATVEDRRLVGRLVRVGEGRLALALPGDTVALAGAERIEFRVRRSRGDGVGRGLLIGAGTGLLATGLLAAVGTARCAGSGDDWCGFGVGVVAVYGGALLTGGGLVLGGLIGGAAPGREWRRADVVQVGMAPARGRPGIGLAVRF